MARKKLKKKAAGPNDVQLPAGRLLQYEITDEPIHDVQYRQLPDEVKNAVDRLYALAQTRPRQAIPELEALIQEYPHLPILYNYLTIAHVRISGRQKAKEMILRHYQMHPDYLFAKIHYAETCLEEGNYEKIGEIFDHKFDLKLLYPKRNRFHTSEYLGFMGIVAPYYLAMGEREIAMRIYAVMHDLNPSHIMTKRLRRLLYPGFFSRLWKRLLGKS